MDSSNKKKKKENIDDTFDVEYNDDVVFEENETESDKIKKLRGKLNKCIEENRANLLGWQRSKADFVNAKKENEERVRSSSVFAKGELMEELLPVIDSFEMAFANKEVWENVDKNWRVGVEYIHTQLLTALENNGLKQINPIGEKFDPNFHTSMEVVETDKRKEDETIVGVVQRGYSLNGKIVRAAKVKVAQYKK